MSEPVLLEMQVLRDLVAELSCWTPIPYTLVYLAKHEPECSPGMAFYVDKWPSCSAVVAVPSSACEFPFLQKAVFLDAKDGDQLQKLLSKVPIDWSKDFYFSAIYQHLRAICDRMSQKYGSLHDDIPEHTMVQKPEYTIPDAEVPDGYVVDRLNIAEASIVMNAWKFTGQFTREAVQHRVEHCILFHPNVAIRDRQGNLVAYELIGPHGTMGMLLVAPEHRGKSLATAAVAQLSKELSRKGHYRYCHVSSENPASIRLHEKCGFVIEKGTDIVWTFFKPK